MRLRRGFGAWPRSCIWQWRCRCCSRGAAVRCGPLARRRLVIEVVKYLQLTKPLLLSPPHLQLCVVRIAGWHHVRTAYNAGCCNTRFITDMRRRTTHSTESLSAPAAAALDSAALLAVAARRGGAAAAPAVGLAAAASGRTAGVAGPAEADPEILGAVAVRVLVWGTACSFTTGCGAAGAGLSLPTASSMELSHPMATVYSTTKCSG